MIARARRAWAAAALAAVLLLPSGAAADVVHLKDGRALEGTVLEDGPARVRIRLRFGGELTFRREEVLRVEQKDLPEEAIAKKRAALDPSDAEGLWALAKEAKELRLRRVHEELVEAVLRADPSHAGANGASGNVELDGEWMKPEERDRRLAERERRSREAQGLVEHEGRWVTPEEKEALERGLVLHDGRWMTEEEAKRLQGFVRWKDGWVRKEDLEAVRLRDVLADAAGVPLTVGLSDRFAVATIYGQSDTDAFLQDCERAYEEFAGIFAVRPGERLFDDPFNHRERRCHVVVLQTEPQYREFFGGLLRFHTELKKVLRPERVELMKRQSGFYLVDPDCWIVQFQAPYSKEQTRQRVVHKLSHVMLFRRGFKGVSWPGWWLVEGLGEVQEVNAFGSCQTFCITTGYGESPGDAKMITDSWKEAARRMVHGGGDRNLKDIMLLDLNDLKPYDLVKSWSVVHYLVALDREKFVALVAAMKGGTKAWDAVREVYGFTPDELDAKWRDFVKRTY